MAFTNRELLARIVQCEAGGEGDNGMRAVATVIMNRVDVATGEYQRVNQGDLRKVIFQAYQFDCARTEIGGKPNMQNIYNMNPEPIHFEIADWALSGGRLGAVGDCLWYFNPYGPCIEGFPRNGNGTFHTAVNAHCFYRPTAAYHLT
ncbi:MAG: cell wall hydrolase [Oscillospiraceae bacterium]|nr:cell wall hydrolase [Oscillospiraceae bacterium]